MEEEEDRGELRDMSRNIGDGNGTEDDHRTQGIGDGNTSGTKRGGGDENGGPRRANNNHEQQGRRREGG